jgi:adenine-specific DNA-methyltransferase
MKIDDGSEIQEQFLGSTASDRSWRPIASREHNKYIAEGASEHQATQPFPTSLLEPFSGQEQSHHAVVHQLIEGKLKQSLGVPFFSDKGFILYRGNCIDLLERLFDSGLKISLTITSPPYNIGKEYERTMPVADYVDWCSKWMGKVYDITTSNGAFWLNIGYLEVPDKGLCVPIPYLLWDKSRFYLQQEIVWKYAAGVSAKRRFSPRNEKWLFYVKNSSQYTFNLDQIRDPNVKYPNQVKNGKYRCHPLGKNPSDVWEYPKITTGRNRSSLERTNHPAQFPLAVVERIVRGSSNPGDILLDPFAGSCSTGIAASGLGRPFVGFEMRQDYCELAVERYEEFKKCRESVAKQVGLF